MTTQTWLMIGAFVTMVVITQLGWRKFTLRTLIQPFILVGIFSFMYIRDIPTAPADVFALALCISLGVVFGALMLLSIRVRRDANGQAYTYGGPVYLLLWLCALGMRVVFASVAETWYPRQFYRFMVSHHVSFSVIAPAFIFMTMAMILVRSIGVALRVRTVRGPGEILRTAEETRVDL